MSFLPFFSFFFCRYAWSYQSFFNTDSTPFWQWSLFFLCKGNIRNKIKLKSPMRALSCNKQRWLNRQRDHRRQKSFRSLFSIKRNITQLGFLKKNLKSYEDVITNCKLGEFYFNCKICSNDGSCIAMGLQLILWDIVTKKTEKWKACAFFNFANYIIKKMQK